jgi:hypothetical protein
VLERLDQLLAERGQILLEVLASYELAEIARIGEGYDVPLRANAA